MKEKIFYTDGACSQNGTWSGGYGVVELDTRIIQKNSCNISSTVIDYYKAEFSENTTNNREEMKAMISALEKIISYIKSGETDTKYTIYTDSAYVCNMCNDWIYKWALNNWYNSKKVQVENLDLVKILYNYLTKNFLNCQISIEKVKGHAGMLGNELVDALAANNTKKWDKLIKDNNIIVHKNGENNGNI